MVPPDLATLVLHVSPETVPARHSAALRALHDLAGVERAEADPVTGTFRIEFDPTRTSVPALVGCLAGHGLPPQRAQLLDEPST